MKISQKLILGFMSVALLTAVVGYVSLVQLNKIAKSEAGYDEGFLSSSKTVNQAAIQSRDLVKTSIRLVSVFIIISLALAAGISIFVFRSISVPLTELKQTEEKLRCAAQEWRTTFDSITDMVSIHDKNFKIVRVNKAFADAFGAEPKEILGKTCYELIHGTKEPLQSCPHKRTVDTRKPHRAEFFEPHLGIYLEASTSPVFDENGEIIGTVHIAKNITERKEAEEKQNKLIEQVENVNQQLKDFAYITSHDLKAPLRGIKTLADWIASDYGDKFDESGKQQLDMLAARTERMHALIEGILQYSRIGRMEEKRAQVDLNELVAKVISMVAPPENVAITVEDKLPVIECEETRIIQVFQNLLSNAVKYMDKPQGWIKIGCVEENGFWKFSVTDNGIGIAAEHLERIFQIFQTLSQREEFESTGVGLTIIKKIVELYGGRIWVESQLGEGSTFFFTLPKQETGIANVQLQADTVGRG